MLDLTQRGIIMNSRLKKDNLQYILEVFTKRLVKKWLNIGLLFDIPL